MKITAPLIVAVLVVAGVAGWQWRGQQEAHRVAQARSDSLTSAYTEIQALHSERAQTDSAARVDSTLWANERATWASRLLVADRRSQRNLVALDSVLGLAPDTVRVVVRETVAALEAEVDACEGALLSADSSAVICGRRLAAADSTVNDLRPLLLAYDAQLADALQLGGRSFFERIFEGLPWAAGGLLVGILIGK